MAKRNVIKIEASFGTNGEFKLERKMYEIIGENEKMFSIADDNFTTISKEDLGYGHQMNVPKLDKTPLGINRYIECNGYFIIEDKKAVELFNYLSSKIDFHKKMIERIV